MKGYRRRNNTSNNRITARTLELNLSTQHDAGVSSTPLTAATQGTTTNMADSPSNSAPFKGFTHDNSAVMDDTVILSAKTCQLVQSAFEEEKCAFKRRCLIRL
nr:uncharacterized protein LOC128698984 [Cherax quadricarinatus]